jgi:beta-lactamase class C
LPCYHLGHASSAVEPGAAHGRQIEFKADAMSALRLGGARIAAAMALLIAAGLAVRADTDRAVERLVTQRIQEMLSPDGIGGAAVAVRIEGRTLFFNYGLSGPAGSQPITSDTLFNLASLRKVFEATVLADAVTRGELKLDDPVAKYVTELQQGRDIRRVTLGQLATHTSGLLLPQDHPPWPDWGYTLPAFVRTLDAWRADKDHEPGRQHIYTHSGFTLLGLALERALRTPIEDLIARRVLHPLGMTSTALPRRTATTPPRLTPQQVRRAVQGYEEDGYPIGKPGDQQTYYHWSGTSQMYSSVRDMAVFLAANLGEQPGDRVLQKAFGLAHTGVLPIGPVNQQALAWEIIDDKAPSIVEKYGGLNNASAYIGMMPSRKLGIVILTNRANQYPNDVGRRILLELAAP